MKTGIPKNRQSSIVTRHCRGMTLVEVLVVLAIVLVLISASARLGQYVKSRSSAQLTRSALSVIDTAMEQYFKEFGAFPFYSRDLNANGRPDDYLKVDLVGEIGAVTGGTVVIDGGDLLEEDGLANPLSGASSAGLYWFLQRSSNTRAIVDALTPSLITTTDAVTKQRLTVTIYKLGGDDMRDLGRFVDPWGTSLWYRYQDGDGFPKVISAGPDRIFGTADDIENK